MLELAMFWYVSVLQFTYTSFAESPKNSFVVRENIEIAINSDAFCENLYFQPESEQKMQEVGCDIQKTEQEILTVKTGIY